MHLTIACCVTLLSSIHAYTIINATVGSTVNLECYDDKVVAWWYQQKSTDIPEDVYAVGQIAKEFEGRFHVHKSTNNNYTLTIYNLQFSDTGNYSCYKKSGFIYSHTFYVNVIKSVVHNMAAYNIMSYCIMLHCIVVALCLS